MHGGENNDDVYKELRLVARLNFILFKTKLELFGIFLDSPLVYANVYLYKC